MNLETIKIALNYSLIGVLINRQTSLTVLIPQKILETIYCRICGNFGYNFADNVLLRPIIIYFVCPFTETDIRE